MNIKFPFFLFIVITLSCSNDKIDYSNDMEICQLMYSMIKTDQTFRIDNKTFQENSTKQSEIDAYNCKTLIKIVKNRGWPSKERYNCDDHPGGVIIFRHAPAQFFTEIAAIIKKEYLAGRMGAGDYNFIRNHLDGRPFTTTEELLKEPDIK